MMRPGVAISALVLTLGMIQPGHAAAVHAGSAVKTHTQAVTGNHMVKAGERHGLRSGRSFGHRRHGRHGRSFRHGRRHRFGHGFRHGHGGTKFFLSLAIPFSHFAFGHHGHHHYYGGHGAYGGSYRYLRHCRKVVKTGYDRFGRRAKIGGTLCFDRYGNSYILSRSRHVIHYY